MAKRKTETFTFDYRVKNPEHLPKAMGSAWLKILKSRLPKMRVKLVSSETTMPQGWDYGNKTIVSLQVNDEEPVAIDFTIRFAGEREKSGSGWVIKSKRAIPLPRNETVSALMHAAASELPGYL